MAERAKKGLWLVRESGDSYGEVYTNSKHLTAAARYMVEGEYSFTVYDLNTAKTVDVIAEMVPAQLTVSLGFPTSDGEASA